MKARLGTRLILIIVAVFLLLFSVVTLYFGIRYNGLALNKETVDILQELQTAEKADIGAQGYWTIRRIVVIGMGALQLIGSLLLFSIPGRIRYKRKDFVVQQNDSGEIRISIKAIENLVRKCTDTHEEFSMTSLRVKNYKDGVVVDLKGTVPDNISIPLATESMQKQIKQYVTACSGVEVKGIRIQIESSGAEAKDAPFAIEPPVNNRLTRGTEEEAEKPLKPEPAPAEHAAEPAEQRAEEEAEKQAQTEEAAAAAAMAAAEDRMKDLDLGDDDRPIHQRLFSAQEEPCIMPLPPENAGETNADSAEKTTEEATENPAGEAPEEMKGENEE
jgi:hypothetical protein